MKENKDLDSKNFRKANCSDIMFYEHRLAKYQDPAVDYRNSSVTSSGRWALCGKSLSEKIRAKRVPLTMIYQRRLCPGGSPQQHLRQRAANWNHTATCGLEYLQHQSQALARCFGILINMCPVLCIKEKR